jgi:NAD(P)-dependent dehydrogenase (short-subunit alcohol dehydrogenase family)
LAQEGALVVGCDIDEAGLAGTEDELATAGLSADLRRVDVTSQVDVDQLIAAISQPVHLLANVAGIMDHFVPLSEIEDTAWERVMSVNLTGVMRLTRAVLPQMQKAGTGAIVTVASEASLRAGAAGVAYTVSKHAVLGLVKHVAYFYGPMGIRSNAVLPGAVATGIGASAAPTSEWAIERAMAALATMGSVAQPVEIATAISWLGCDEASNVNGAIMTTDGGWSTA